MNPDITAIINEEAERSSRYAKDHFGARNGDEFPELATAALKSKFVEGTILAQTLLSAISGSAIATSKGAESMKPEDVSHNQDFNRGFLDLFWLGYRVGRRLEQHEREVLDNIEKQSV